MTQTSNPTLHTDHGYDALLASAQTRFLAALPAGTPLFTTDADDLFGVYLDALPPDGRQHHTCHTCRNFLRTYGGLVLIEPGGVTRPAVWNEADAPAYYAPAMTALARAVRRAKVTGVFLSPAKVWGTPLTGTWTHFTLTPPASAVYTPRLLTAGQAMAEKLEDFRNVSRALAEFDASTLDTAIRLLDSEALYRSEKVAGPARWLRGLHRDRGAVRGEARDNIAWRAVATAPAGFCHPRSSMVGTLLEDIVAGLDFATVSSRFAAKMHPLQYQRPQVAPDAGNIANAEKIVEKLGIARSLERRFARLEEIETIWRPKAVESKPAGAGVFAHLAPKGSEPARALDVPPITMTWVKFAATVLPTAETIELHVPSRGGFTAFVTAVHADAPPILQWDRDDRRNPFSWYLYVSGSPAEQWGLTIGWSPLTAISLQPNLWGADPMTHQGEGVALIIKDAKDSHNTSLSLFPEILRSELHQVRSTIEAFSRAGQLAGHDEASACGLILQKGRVWNADVCVTASGTTQRYRIDRWE